MVLLAGCEAWLKQLHMASLTLAQLKVLLLLRPLARELA